MGKYINPKNDLAFRKIFGSEQSQTILDLQNSVNKKLYYLIVEDEKMSYKIDL